MRCWKSCHVFLIWIHEGKTFTFKGKTRLSESEYVCVCSALNSYFECLLLKKSFHRTRATSSHFVWQQRTKWQRQQQQQQSNRQSVAKQNIFFILTQNFRWKVVANDDDLMTNERSKWKCERKIVLHVIRCYMPARPLTLSLWSSAVNYTYIIVDDDDDDDDSWGSA